MKQVEVQIMGQSYKLACPEEGEARLLEAVRKVDAAMCKIRDAGKVRARDRIAVLAALNLAFDVPNTPPEPAPPPSPPPAMPLDSNATQTDVMRHLLQRLDQALAHDGRLL